MATVCIERPNRKERRLFSATDVARIYCRVLDQGTDRTVLIKIINNKCGTARICDCDRVILLLIELSLLLATIIDTILTPISIIITAIRAGVGRFAFLRRVPGLRGLFRVLDRTIITKLNADAALINLENLITELSIPQPQ